MTVWEWIRFLAGAVLMLAGLFVVVTSVVGNYRFKFVLNRMQAAALGDTLGVLLCMAGAMVFSGFTVFTLKLLIIILFFWLSSPVASHLLVYLEISTGEDIKQEDKAVKK